MLFRNEKGITVKRGKCSSDPKFGRNILTLVLHKGSYERRCKTSDSGEGRVTSSFSKLLSVRGRAELRPELITKTELHKRKDYRKYYILLKVHRCVPIPSAHSKQRGPARKNS